MRRRPYPNQSPNVPRSQAASIGARSSVVPTKQWRNALHLLRSFGKVMTIQNHRRWRALDNWPQKGKTLCKSRQMSVTTTLFRSFLLANSVSLCIICMETLDPRCRISDSYGRFSLGSGFAMRECHANENRYPKWYLLCLCRQRCRSKLAYRDLAR